MEASGRFKTIFDAVMYVWRQVSAIRWIGYGRIDLWFLKGIVNKIDFDFDRE